jgi:hypothetical protein
MMTLKPRGYPLVPLGQPDPADGVTVRLRSLIEAGEDATVSLFTGIAAATVTDVLERGNGAAVDYGAGSVTVKVPPRGVVTFAVDPADLASVRNAAQPSVPASHPAPEPAQPVFTRYWLHGKGPAPAGNLPVAVYLSPGFVAPAPGETTVVRLSVACGPAPVSGTVTLGIPASLRLVSVRPAGPTGTGLVAATGHVTPGPLHYHLQSDGYAAWDLVVQVPPEAPRGRHFVTAMIIDGAGQLCEDAVVVAVGEPQSTQDLTFDELTPLIEAASQAEAAESELTRLTSDLDLRPGDRGEISVRLANHTASELRGEAQLISSHGSWSAVGPWTMGFTAAPGGDATMTFTADVPHDARPGQRWWALVKVMYFGRLRYSEPVWITVAK